MSIASVDKGMDIPDVKCSACGFNLTNLGKLRVTDAVYYWWECESCDRVWYVRQGGGQPAIMSEWKNHPTINV